MRRASGHGFPDKKVDVSGVPWTAVSSNRVATDHCEPNSMREQQFGALFEVSVEVQFRIHTFVT